MDGCESRRRRVPEHELVLAESQWDQRRLQRPLSSLLVRLAQRLQQYRHVEFPVVQ